MADEAKTKIIRLRLLPREHRQMSEEGFCAFVRDRCDTGLLGRTSEVRLVTTVTSLLSSVTSSLSAVQSYICQCTVKVVSLASIKRDSSYIRTKHIMPIRKSRLTCCSSRAVINTSSIQSESRHTDKSYFSSASLGTIRGNRVLLDYTPGYG